MRAASLLAVAALAVAGCEAGPTTRDLYGRWEATSDGITRAFHFDATIADDGRPELDGVSPAFIAYRYAAGGGRERPLRGPRRHAGALGALGSDQHRGRRRARGRRRRVGRSELPHGRRDGRPAALLARRCPAGRAVAGLRAASRRRGPGMD